MTEWVEVNLPWRFFNEKESADAALRHRHYNNWWIAKRVEMYGDNPKPSLEFNNWLKEQPETKAWQRREEEYKASVEARQFASHLANKPGVIIEVRNENGDVGQHLIGDVLTDGGSGGEYGLDEKDTILRYLDISEIIKESTPP